MQRFVWTAGILLLGCQDGSKGPMKAPPETSAAAVVTGPNASATTVSGSSSTEPLPSSIGSATMAKDGTITMFLRATGGGAVGDGMAVYPRSHPKYKEVLEHLGGLEPGETKPVPPWE